MHSNILLLESFLKSAKLVIKDYPKAKTDIFDLINHISEHPGLGDVVPGFAGKIIKIRGALKSYSIGTRGGLRVYYFYHGGLLAPFFIYTKKQMTDAPKDLIEKLVSYIEERLTN
jgi:hypothetical protein